MQLGSSCRGLFLGAGPREGFITFFEVPAVLGLEALSSSVEVHWALKVFVAYGYRQGRIRQEGMWNGTERTRRFGGRFACSARQTDF